MVSKEEIKKLALLARIEVEDDALEGLRADIESILDYVGQVKSMSGQSLGVDAGALINVWREDENPTESGTYSEEIIKEFPQEERGYLKVRKIL